MLNYLRARVGNTYFFTVVTHRRRPFLCDDRPRTALRAAITETRASHPFVIEAWVLLPDHLQTLYRIQQLERLGSNYAFLLPFLVAFPLASFLSFRYSSIVLFPILLFVLITLLGLIVHQPKQEY